MAYVTVSQVIALCRSILNDRSAQVFTDTYLLPFVQMKVMELNSVFRLNQLPDAKMIGAPYTLTAGTTSLAPATAGWTNLGEIDFLEERTAGSADKYEPLDMVEVLDQRAPSLKLDQFTFNREAFGFIGATGNRELRLHYFMSADGLALVGASTIAVDDAANFLAHATAAAAGPPNGHDGPEVSMARDAAYGAGNRNPLVILGGYLQALVDTETQKLQQMPVQMPRFASGRRRRFN